MFSIDSNFPSIKYPPLFFNALINLAFSYANEMAAISTSLPYRTALEFFIYFKIYAWKA